MQPMKKPRHPRKKSMQSRKKPWHPGKKSMQLMKNLMQFRKSLSTLGRSHATSYEKA
jgi:hypothetical protein